MIITMNNLSIYIYIHTSMRTMLMNPSKESRLVARKQEHNVLWHYVSICHLHNMNVGCGYKPLQAVVNSYTL